VTYAVSVCLGPLAGIVEEGPLLKECHLQDGRLRGRDLRIDRAQREEEMRVSGRGGNGLYNICEYIYTYTKI
jgi:hypothetical protein